MKILITGGAGFIGSVLVRDLLNSNYKVTILDNFTFGLESIKEIKDNPNLKIVRGDIRKSEDIERAIKDIDVVIHLAALVGDPACAAQADIAYEVNFTSTIKLADMCRSLKINKFIFASTCSVYGASESDVKLTEKSKLNPVSLYAETRLYAEQGILALANKDFSPIILRFGTVYGISPRMRFDLIVNYLTQKAVMGKKIGIFGGTQWRPFIHVNDISRAVQLFLEAPLHKVRGEVFNVGSTDENYQMKRLGEVVKEILPDTKVNCIEEIKDKRSYNVSFDKIKDVLGFKTEKTIKDGIIEIAEAIKKGVIKDPSDPKYYNHLVKLALPKKTEGITL
ncbi:MAG: SDR family NAD(P)-dependent oxidoreductase [Candidatus Aenigmarchaeota archaeon]|nr:SDR family NAD(P)-dependent oxidoreductase [Candidatus Aenigmarchaeota archaeon]